MCGIAGILGTNDRVGIPMLERVSRHLAHRGPDDEGIEVVPVVDSNRQMRLGLVHRRLSIIDLSSAGHQPMQDGESGTWIVFNGEIYNYRKIRSELESGGCAFRSHSDTEVILKAYARWGEGCVEKLRGMFAFAIWDSRQRRLFVAIDRFGIKPLYYASRGTDGFLFSSEVRAALSAGFIEPKVDPTAVESFLAFGAIQAPLTIIEDLRSLLPGHLLTYDFDTGVTRTRQYWSPARALALRTSPADERIAGEVLRDAVRHHLVSDVPVGLFLSGGIDSSALAILVSETPAAHALQSFSVSFAESDYSERAYSKLMADRIGCRHHEIVVSEDDLHHSLPSALSALDQPSIDGVNTYTISRVVHDAGVRAVLSGQGGDEVFGGYNTFDRIPRITAMLAGTRRLLPASQRERLARVVARLSGGSVFGAKAAQAVGSASDLVSIYLISRQLFAPAARRRLLRSASSGGTENGLPLAAADWYRREVDGLDAFNAISVLEMRGFMGNMLLRDGDTMSMAHGLEIRVPFLDHELVECVFAIDASKKRSGRTPKPLLTGIVGDALPRAIYQRRKMGFTFPWDIWMRNRLRGEIDDVLAQTEAADVMGIDVDEARRLWRGFLAREPGVSWSRIWAIYVLLSWANRHIVEQTWRP